MIGVSRVDIFMRKTTLREEGGIEAEIDQGYLMRQLPNGREVDYGRRAGQTLADMEKVQRTFTDAFITYRVTNIPYYK